MDSFAPDHQPAVIPPRQRKDVRLYGNESTLFSLMAIISILTWVVLTIVTVGLVWLLLLLLYGVGLAAFSYFISHVRGNGVRVTADQFPDLHARFTACCTIVELAPPPQFYLLTGNGVLNAFATRFLRRNYVVLYSDIVDALDDDPAALNFYIGHELGHIVQRHLIHHWWLIWARWLPLLATAYSRAREYSCDQYGLLCTDNQRSAIHAMAVLAAGRRRWKDLNVAAYIAQREQSGGFWMALNELTAPYPWLCKRVARVALGQQATAPRRHPLAWALAALVPNTGFGLIGGLLLYVYALMVVLPFAMGRHQSTAAVAALAVARGTPAAQRATLTRERDVGLQAARLVTDKYLRDHLMPASLDEIGFKNTEPALVPAIIYAPGKRKIELVLAPPFMANKLLLVYTPSAQQMDRWQCVILGPIDADAVPPSCAAATPIGAPSTSLLDRLLRMT